jgi:hypothetical protein
MMYELPSAGAVESHGEVKKRPAAGEGLPLSRRKTPSEPGRPSSFGGKREDTGGSRGARPAPNELLLSFWCGVARKLGRCYGFIESKFTHSPYAGCSVFYLQADVKQSPAEDLLLALSHAQLLFCMFEPCRAM